MVQADAAGFDLAAGGAVVERQLRWPGQVRDALAPPGEVVVADLTGGPVGGDRREGDAQFGQRLPAVETSEVVDEDAIAHGVGRDHVDVEMHPGGVVGQQAQFGADDRTLFDRECAMCSMGTLFGEDRLDHLGRLVAQVVDGDRVRVRRPDDLGAVGEYADPEHRMTLEQLTHGGGEAVGIDVVAVELDVEVRGHIAERMAVGSPDPIGVLHRRQRER